MYSCFIDREEEGFGGQRKACNRLSSRKWNVVEMVENIMARSHRNL